MPPRCAKKSCRSHTCQPAHTAATRYSQRAVASRVRRNATSPPSRPPPAYSRAMPEAREPLVFPSQRSQCTPCRARMTLPRFHLRSATRSRVQQQSSHQLSDGNDRLYRRARPFDACRPGAHNRRLARPFSRTSDRQIGAVPCRTPSGRGSSRRSSSPSCSRQARRRPHRRRTGRGSAGRTARASCRTPAIRPSSAPTAT